MNEGKIIRQMLERSHVTAAKVSRDMGKKPSYVGNVVNQTSSSPRCDTMADIANELGYDLVVRDRDDGYEFIIPPTQY